MDIGNRYSSQKSLLQPRRLNSNQRTLKLDKLFPMRLTASGGSFYMSKYLLRSNQIKHKIAIRKKLQKRSDGLNFLAKLKNINVLFLSATRRKTTYPQCVNHRRAATKAPNFGTGSLAYQAAVVVHGEPTQEERKLSNTREREKKQGEMEEEGKMKKSVKRKPTSQERERLNEEMSNLPFCANLYGGSNYSKIYPNHILLAQQHVPHMTHSSQANFPNKALLCKPNCSPWIFDCGATYTMTFEPTDLLSTTPTSRTKIETTNGECAEVTQAGNVDVTSSMKL